ncbi:MAG TPA: protease complex subunit PrcB family protein, partial [Rhodocyclaceae bacterium]
VALGQRPTAGYGLELASTRGELRDRQLSIEISRQQPAADSMTAQVLTSPCLLIEIDAAANRVDAVVVRDPAVGSVAR